MQKEISLMPGYRLYDYLLVLDLPADLGNRVRKIKEEFAAKFRTGQLSRGGVSIPLVRFSQIVLMEDRILNRLHTLALGFPPFKVELKDFGSFPTHTLFINVVSKIPVQRLVKSIRSETQRLMKPDEDHKPHFILEPHISLARKLLPWQYEKGWLEYQQRHFTGRFIAGNMTLLRKGEEETVFSKRRTFEFKNWPVLTKQGELW